MNYQGVFYRVFGKYGRIYMKEYEELTIEKLWLIEIGNLMVEKIH